jgi:hypothetical protein
MPDNRHLAYFVHDLGDAAVLRRVRMLHAGGARVTVVGFRRREQPIASLDGARTIDLGQTRDGRFVHRVWAVVRTLARFEHVRQAVRDADAIMARNLEMLVIGARARRGRRLVYECLDIHRLLLGRGSVSRVIRSIEAWALARVSLIITSSNRFADDYFRQRRGFAGQIQLVENKVLAIDGGADRALPTSGGPRSPPWTIGWFGMLRCRRSLTELSRLVLNGNGAIRVLIAGIPSDHEFDDFAGAVAAVPGMEYVGPYASADLARLYGRVHFAWAIDYFEEGLNSAWLLPNRLYEAMAHAVVPVALNSVETGHWLKRHDVGITVDQPTADLPNLLLQMDAAAYRAEQLRIGALPDGLLFTCLEECRDLVDRIFMPD